jgi:hypothetical protein
MSTRDDQHELPPQPKPRAVRPPAAPGGVDAVTFPTGPNGTEDPVIRDVGPQRNPATNLPLPEGTTDREDTSTRATRNDQESDPHEESPA